MTRAYWGLGGIAVLLIYGWVLKSIFRPLSDPETPAQNIAELGMSPAACRFIYSTGRYGGFRVFYCALLGAAQKGALAIEESGGEFLLRKTESGVDPRLTEDEWALLAKLFEASSAVSTGEPDTPFYGGLEGHVNFSV